MSNNQYDAVIVGAGFSGLAMAYQLQKLGFKKLLIVEKAADIGGTWRDAVYPGAGCDVPSHLYSYSFYPKSDWTRAYANQPEILQYIKNFVASQRLQSIIRLNCEIIAADFDDTYGQWNITTGQGDDIESRHLILAIGFFSEPSTLGIKGAEKFSGEVVHAARWPDKIDLKDKNIAVVGSGASAIQLVPEVAKQAKTVTIFQRTPAWIVPKLDFAISDKKQKRYQHFPLLLKLRRWYLYWRSELGAMAIIKNTGKAKQQLTAIAKAHIKRGIKDKALRKEVTPDYMVGCSRLLVSNDWYPTLEQDHVTLINQGVSEIDEHHVTSISGQNFKADMIILTTGYDISFKQAPFPITGLNNQQLDQTWSGHPQAYKGMTVHGYPNLFFLGGPNAGPSHTSLLQYVEMQVSYIAKAIKKLKHTGDLYLHIKPQVQQQYNQQITSRMESTAWQAGGCSSWYLSDSGKNFTMYPGYNWEFRLRLSWFDSNDYSWHAASSNLRQESISG